MADFTPLEAAAARASGLKDRRGACASATVPSPVAVAASMALRVNKLLICNG